MMLNRIFAELEKKPLFFLCLIVFLSIALVSLSYDFFLISDSWEREKISSEIISTGSFPQTNPSFGKPYDYVYPPLFDVLTANLTFFGKISYFQSLILLSLLHSILLTIAVFLLANCFAGKKIALLSALMVFAIPRIFWLSIHVIPETIGLSIILLIIFFALKKSFKTSAFLFAMLSLFHIRSFFNAGILLILFFIFFRGHFSKRIAYYPLFFLVIAPIFWLKKLDSLFFPQMLNPFVIQRSLFELFAFAIVFAVMGILLFEKKKEFWFLFSWILVFFSSIILEQTGLTNYSGFRELVFAFFPISFFSAVFLSKISKSKIVFTAIFCISFAALFFFLLYHPPGIKQKEVSMIDYLKNMEDKTIIGGYNISYAIPNLSGKQVVIGANMESISTSIERTNDVYAIFATRNQDEAAKIMRKYDSKTIVAGSFEWNNRNKLFDFNKFSEQIFDKVYATNSNAIFLLNE